MTTARRIAFADKAYLRMRYGVIDSIPRMRFKHSCYWFPVQLSPEDPR